MFNIFNTPSFNSDCNVGEVIKAAKDDAMAERLWEVSEKMVGLCRPSESDNKTKE